MKIYITLLVDNHPAPGLKSPWGLSVFVKYGSIPFLWDTGPDPAALKYNANKLGIDLSKIEFVAISHEHFDHTGGLPYIFSLQKHPLIYYPHGGSKIVENRIAQWGGKIIEISRTTEIKKGIFITAPLYGPPVEEALAMVTNKGLILLVGCSHPGADKLAERAVKDTGKKLFAVIGGFHLLSSPRQKVERTILALIKMGAKKIAPVHCSGDYAREFLKKKYPSIYLPGRVGTNFTFEQ